MKLKDQNRKTYAELLLLFSELYKFPEEEFYKEIKSGEFDRQIAELGKSLNDPVTANFKDQIGSYPEMVEAFNHCFLGIKAPFAPPVESVYKTWTTDQSCQAPHKNQKGYLMGDSALHVKHILDSFGLEIPQEYALMPDHLTILLEIGAFLLRQELPAETRQFIHDHLDWLPDYTQALCQVEQSRFYLYATEKLQHILSVQNQSIQ